MEAWDGKNQRSDHDMLTRIDANLANFMKRFDEHVKQDEESFEKLDQRTSKLEKFMWAALGIVFVIEVIFRVWR